MTDQPTDEVLLARAYLMRVAEPPAGALGLLVAAEGPVRAAALVRAGRVPDAVAAETSARRGAADPAADLAAGDAAGLRLLVPEDADWPAWPLLALDTASARGQRWAGSPLGLWVRGSASLTELLDRAVAVVGARASTGYGEHVATEFGYGLAERDWTVVSGAAYGIDGAAHRGCLTAGGPTVAVLGCGADGDYPTGHAGLLTRIAESGAVISEYPPGTPPGRHRFLVRNRLIAAFGAGTVVVEAGLRSGARNTAATAAALGRPVMATPGPITSAMSAGCHELIRTAGATLTASVAQVIEQVGRFGDELAEPPPSPRRDTDGLGEQAVRVLDALAPRSGRGADEVSIGSGVPIDRVRALLPELELTGLVDRRDDGWRLAGTDAETGASRRTLPATGGTGASGRGGA